MSELNIAYDHCRSITRGHYENFPVASLFIPGRLRPHVAAVYAFARHADDLADEGDIDDAKRLEALAEWRLQLEHCTETDSSDPVFLALGDTIRRYSIPVSLFHDLLNAFEQDVINQKYETFEEVHDYCRCSANPVGRIILSLFSLCREETAILSDALCTGLQLANFWQDISVDRKKKRLYLPAEDLRRFDLSAVNIFDGVEDDRTRALVAFQVRRSRQYFLEAVDLFDIVPIRLRLELKAVWSGGMRILDKIEKLGYNVVHRRPELSATDGIKIALSAFISSRATAQYQ